MRLQRSFTWLLSCMLIMGMAFQAPLIAMQETVVASNYFNEFKIRLAKYAKVPARQARFLYDWGVKKYYKQPISIQEDRRAKSLLKKIGIGVVVIAGIIVAIFGGKYIADMRGQKAAPPAAAPVVIQPNKPSAWDDFQALFAAIRNDDLKAVNELLDRGVDINMSSTIAGYETPLIAAIKQGRDAIALALIVRTADLEEDDASRQTPLMWAIRTNSVDIVTKLLEKGAKIDHMALNGKTPLGLAIELNNPPMVQLLLDRNARIFDYEFNLAIQQGNQAIVNMLAKKMLEKKLK